MQKIVIEHNGPIENFEMEVKNFNLIIGEQATGKSTIAKSIYFFRYIKTMVIDYLTQVYNYGSYNGKNQKDQRFYKDLNHELKNIFVKLFGYSQNLDPNFSMRYVFSDGDVDIKEIKDIKVKMNSVDSGNQLIDINFSKKLTDAIDYEKERVETWRQQQRERTYQSIALEAEENKSNQEYIINAVNEIFDDNKETYYIPAGRNIITLLSDKRASVNSIRDIDLVTEIFMQQIDRVRNLYADGISGAYQRSFVERSNFDAEKIADMIIHMEKGEYCYSKGREILRLPDGKHKVHVNYTSSGQQEVLWILNFLYALMLRQENAFVIIEEPEANIYPTLQKEVVEFISLFANTMGGNVLITTHSPYVLTAVNNLYYAGIVEAKTGDKDRVHQVIDQDKVIPHGSLSAFKLNSKTDSSRDSGYVSLFDEDDGEIDIELIDDVSSEIDRVYTALYDIELDEKDED